VSLGGARKNGLYKNDSRAVDQVSPFHKEFLVTFWRFALCASGDYGLFKLEPRETAL
jgi:hypothetical protein